MEGIGRKIFLPPTDFVAKLKKKKMSPSVSIRLLFVCFLFFMDVNEDVGREESVNNRTTGTQGHMAISEAPFCV